MPSDAPAANAAPKAAPLGRAIVHIGFGNFCRAHLASFIHDYYATVGASEWGIVGIDRDTPRTVDMIEFLTSTGFTYQIRADSSTQSDISDIRSVIDLINMGVEPEKALTNLIDPQTRICSLTITEKGYYCDLQTGQLKMNHELEHDLTPEGRTRPKSMHGLVVEALQTRRAAGMPGFTLMSLDNIPGNGNILKKAIMQFAELTSHDGLADWIETHVSFPNSMVDRITPNTKTAADIVATEPFRQWVVEDKFVNGRPVFEVLPPSTGIIITADVLPYEHMKVRLLNGSHSALSYLSYLAGHRFVDQAMADPKVAMFVHAYLRETVMTVHEVKGISLDAYQDLLLQRFSNPKISDMIQRLCEDGSMKASSFWKPVLEDHIAGENPFTLIGLATAGWIRYSTGKDEAGEPIVIKDPAMAHILAPLAEHAVAHGNVGPFLEAAFGPSLARMTVFSDEVTRWLQMLVEKGAAEVLEEVRGVFSRDAVPAGGLH